jgi:hypothetical protein
MGAFRVAGLALVLFLGASTPSGVLARGQQLDGQDSLGWAYYLTAKYGGRSSQNATLGTSSCFTSPTPVDTWLAACTIITKATQAVTTASVTSTPTGFPVHFDWVIDWTSDLLWKSTLEYAFNTSESNGTVTLTAFDNSVAPCKDLLANNTKRVFIPFYRNGPASPEAVPFDEMKVVCDGITTLQPNRTCDVFTEIDWKAADPKLNPSWALLPAVNGQGPADQWRVGFWDWVTNHWVQIVDTVKAITCAWWEFWCG